VGNRGRENFSSTCCENRVEEHRRPNLPELSSAQVNEIEETGRFQERDITTVYLPSDQDANDVWLRVLKTSWSIIRDSPLYEGRRTWFPVHDRLFDSFGRDILGKWFA